MTDEPIPTGEAEPSRADLIDALRRAGMDGWVRQFVVMVQLAAELYPEEIRAALGYVFDLRCVTEQMGRITVMANHAELKLADVVATTGWLDREAGPLLEAHARDIVDLQKRVQDAALYVRGLVTTLKRGGVLRDKPTAHAGQKGK